MNILITGYRGFIGRNLTESLAEQNMRYNLFLYDRSNNDDDLNTMCRECDIVFHLAAVVRPSNPMDYSNNTSLTNKMINYLRSRTVPCPIVFASSIQAELDNPYAECKREEEKLILKYGSESNVPVYIFRFPNLFGKYSRPNYTSVISTFCYNTSHNYPITINNPAATIHFAYISDVLTKVIETAIRLKEPSQQGIINIEEYSEVTLGELAYYMSTLKDGVEPKIERSDSFYNQLKSVYEWFKLQSFDK